MIDAIVYSSLSGSCEEYAHRMSAALHVPFFTEQSHICPTGRKVVYIGWLLAGKVVGLDKAKERYNVVGVVSVGMGAPAANAEEVCRKKNGLGSDIAVFPLQGRFDLKRLPLPYRLIMKIKIKDIAKRLNAKAAKTTLTDAEHREAVRFAVEHTAGRIPVIACPKLDNNGDYAERLARLFAMRPASVTLLRMSAPCCAALEHLARQAQEAAGSHAALHCHTVRLPR